MNIHMLIKLVDGYVFVAVIAFDFHTIVAPHMLKISFQGNVALSTRVTFDFAVSIPFKLNRLWSCGFCFWNTTIILMLFLLQQWIDIGYIGLLRMGCIKIKVLINRCIDCALLKYLDLFEFLCEN